MHKTKHSFLANRSLLYPPWSTTLLFSLSAVKRPSRVFSPFYPFLQVSRKISSLFLWMLPFGSALCCKQAFLLSEASLNNIMLMDPYMLLHCPVLGFILGGALSRAHEVPRKRETLLTFTKDIFEITSHHLVNLLPSKPMLPGAKSFFHLCS